MVLSILRGVAYVPKLCLKRLHLWDLAQLLDYTREGVRRHLKSTMGVDLRRTYVKFNLVRTYVKRSEPCTVRSKSVQ